MIQIYSDEEKTDLLFDSIGKVKSQSNRKDDFGGDVYRSDDGDLLSYEKYNKFETRVIFEEVSESDKDIIKSIVDNRQRVFYMPDSERRSDETYEVMFEPPFQAKYDYRTYLYTINLRVREV